MTQDRFDPSRFRPQPSLFPLEQRVEAILTEEPPQSPHNSGARAVGQFACVPMTGWNLFPPQSRLLLLLQRLSVMFPADENGGWYRLSSSRLNDAGLDDRFQRRRALEQLERNGILEVDRRNGRQTILVRFSATAAGLLRWQKVGVARERRAGPRSYPKMRVIDADTGTVTELDLSQKVSVGASQ